MAAAAAPFNAAGAAPLGVHEHPPGVHAHVHGNHTHSHDTKVEGLVFYFLLFGMMGMQYGLAYWKRSHPKSFRTASLAGLWLVPAVTSLPRLSFRFLSIWTAYSLAVAYHYRLARQKPLQPTTPRAVYRFFDVAYTLTSNVAGCAFACMAVLVFTGPLAALLPEFVAASIVLGMLYGTYFAVLTRDAAEVAAETMAANLGYSKKEDDDASRPVPRGLCALCGEGLQPAGGEEAGAGEDLYSVLARLDGTPAVKAGSNAGPRGSRGAVSGAGGAADPGAKKATVRIPVGDGQRCVFRLECGHLFHEYCIKGWCIVGKKGCCPCCVERVDLRAISGETLFARSSLLWMQLLDVVRYLTVWLPLLMLTMRLVFWEAGINLASGLDQGAAATNATTAVNATLPHAHG